MSAKTHAADVIGGPDGGGTAGRRKALAVADVRIDDPFWSPRLAVLRERTLPHLHRQLREVGQLDALRLTWRPGDGKPPHIFWDSDVAKWIEAASYVLATGPDPELDADVDAAIELLAGAQQADGYLNSHYSVTDPGQRFTDLRDGHELYCAGHLIEAAVAHHQGTGKDSLLRIARRYADLIERELGPGGCAEGGYPGHPELELALVKLARETGERRYAELASRLVYARGRQPFYFEAEAARRGNEGYFGSYFTTRPSEPERFRRYNLSHQPVTEQTEVVGHAVRAMYLYCAMADLAAEGDADLAAACDRLWRNLVERKLYVTGAVGSDDDLEAFGPDFDLPVEGGYRETCASIGLIMWARRMALATGDGAYMDVAEQALYNTVLASASADGESYFYDNPLSSAGSVVRRGWFGVACCPPNLARLLGSLGGYAFSAGDREVCLDLFMSGRARFAVDGAGVEVEVTTRYPVDGRVEVRVDPGLPVGRDRSEGELAEGGDLALGPGRAMRFAVLLRVPGWAGGGARVMVNGVPVSAPIEGGYVRLERDWSPGDVIALDLPMTPRRVWARPVVAGCAGLVALRRGPLVYCVEGLDNGGPVSALALDPDSAAVDEPIEVGEYGELPGIRVAGYREIDDGEPPLYRDAPAPREPVDVLAVPYFAWGNRGASSMQVWIRQDDRGRSGVRPPK